MPVASLGFWDKLGVGSRLEQGIILGKLVHKQLHRQALVANPPSPLLKGLLSQPAIL